MSGPGLPDGRPNILLILADDMGFSDIGCYGSEIFTPNIDRLGEMGVRFTQAYNCARCCPSRASLYTGLYPHQTGIGHMVRDDGLPGYRGFLNDRSVTIAEALRDAGYSTSLAGKWHVGGEYHPKKPDSWTPGEPGFPTPQQRGFDRFYGILRGGGSYFEPKVLMREHQWVEEEDQEFYFTDAITDYAIARIDESVATGAPFFVHVAYTAPHWPLHAREEDIARYEGTYRDGWDTLRTRRHEEMKGLGIVDKRWPISARDPAAPPWHEVEEVRWEDQRMAVYAAQVDRMDQGIGRIMNRLRELGQERNTLVIFLSDNGGCAEFLAEDTNDSPFRYNFPTRDGRKMTVGNSPRVRPGPADTFQSYDLPWANASNAPFRLFKRWVHEGGISTPMIVTWPEQIPPSRIEHSIAHFVDIMPTCLDAAGVARPTESHGQLTLPGEGTSLLADLCGGAAWSREGPLFWEHEGNRAVRDGMWKLVARGPDRPWELYNMENDRTETDNRAEAESGIVAGLAAEYERWAERCGVLPFPVSQK